MPLARNERGATMEVESEVEKARCELGTIALAMLNGKFSFIMGPRKLVSLRERAKLAQFDPDIVPFVAIDSETDALPVGEVRKFWSTGALAKSESKAEAAERWARDVGAKPCQNLIDRFKPAAGKSPTYSN